MPEGSFFWYELVTPDPGAAKAFYDAVVGWDIEPEPTGELDYRMIGLKGGGNAGGVLRLSDEMREHGARPMWLGYIGVEDVDATIAATLEDGAKLLMPAWDVPGVGRIAMIADPQGAPVYLMTPSTAPASKEQKRGVFSVDQPQHVRWNELSTTDPAAAIAFYSRHFGWRQEGDMDMGAMGKYQFLYDGDVMIGAVMPKMPKMPEMPVSLWSFYTGVDDIDRAAEAIRSGGGTILMGPMEIPGGEYSVNALDPQGAAFGLVGPRNA